MAEPAATRKNVIFIGILERVVDELKHVEWQLQAEGSKTSRELPAIVDQIITYQFLDFGDGKPPLRGFVCRSPNQWGYPAKDRSGRLDTVEEPDLGKLLAKLTNQLFDVVPANTICVLQMTVRPGGGSDDGWLKPAADGNSEGLDCEYTIVEPEQYRKKKLWQVSTLRGTTDGHAEAGRISREFLKAVLESAKGIRPDDKSEAAQNARKPSGWADFDQLRFVARLGVRPPRDGYPAKNIILQVITPDRQDWQKHKPEQISGAKPPNSATPAAPTVRPAGAIERPQWGRK